MTKLNVDSSSINIYNLTGGGNITNTGSGQSVVNFFNLIAPYNNVRWNNLTQTTLLTTNFFAVMSLSERIEIFYGLSSGVAQSISGGSIKPNYTIYLKVIGGLILIVIILLIAMAEGYDRIKKRIKK